MLAVNNTHLRQVPLGPDNRISNANGNEKEYKMLEYSNYIDRYSVTRTLTSRALGSP